MIQTYKNNNILLVAAVSYAGMGPYATTIINSFSAEDKVWFFLLDNKNDLYFSKNIKPELLNKSCISFYKENNLKKLLDYIFKTPLLKYKLIKYCKLRSINTIHFLTDERYLVNKFKNLQSKYHIVLTVHDLEQHIQKKVWWKEWFANAGFRIIRDNFNSIKHLVSNNKEQIKELAVLFPQKKIDYFDFPTLITPRIDKGNKKVPELIKKKKYVLFFGRIELYKGVHNVYNIFLNDKRFKDYILVIAGSGDIYWERNISNEKNIVFVNRYIQDEEIRNLYEKSTIVIYPYLSVTQSGVISIAAYFNKPMLASDLSFFKPIIDYGAGICYNTNDYNDLADKLFELINSEKKNDYIKNCKTLYTNIYDHNTLKNKLINIYNNS